MPAQNSSGAPYALTITKVLELIKGNTITVEEYTNSLLDRIQERDSTVKAWAYLGKHGNMTSEEEKRDND